MLYKIKRNRSMHPLYGALSVSYLAVRVTRGALIEHRCTYAPPRCRTAQDRRTFIPLSVSVWNDITDPVFDDVGLSSFKSWANAFLLVQAARYLLSSIVLPSPFCLLVGIVG